MRKGKANPHRFKSLNGDPREAAVAQIQMKQLFLRRFVKGGLLYLDADTPVGQQEKARIVVLSKNTYFETERTFPFTPLKDIGAAVQTDTGAYAPFDTDRFFFRKIREADGSARVNLWFVKPEAAKALDRLSPICVIPETFLFVFMAPSWPAFFTVEKSPEKRLVVNVDTQGAVKSLFGRPDASARDGFLRSCRLPENGQEQHIDDFEAYRQFLEAAVLALPIRESLRFVNKPASMAGLTGKSILRYLGLALLLWLIYTGATSWMIYQTEQTVKAREGALRKKAAELMEKRELLDKRLDRLEFLRSRTRYYQPRTRLMALILRKAPEGVLIKRIQVAGQSVEIEGLAPNASDFMTALSDAKAVASVRFSAPLRKDSNSGKERFSLMFETVTASAAASDEDR